MHSNKLLILGGLLVAWIAVAGSARAQLQPSEPDPLARMRAAAASAQSQACTIKEPSACAAATPKIVANALASPPLAENLRHLSGTASGPSAATGSDSTVKWAEAAFRAAGVDEVRIEDTAGSRVDGRDPAKGVNVVAEIQGREKPAEFVVLGARLPSGGQSKVTSPDSISDDACNAALVIEAARDIHLTGLRPLRSIRFVLFSTVEDGLFASRAYVSSHRAELDDVIGAAIFEQGCNQVNGFSLGGRRDIEPGVREAFAVAPIDSWHVGNVTYDARWGADNFDFLLEGVPTLLPNREDADALRGGGTTQSSGENSALDTLRHNAAIAGVLAFALAEHPALLGPRQSRVEIQELLSTSGLDARMKAANIWQDWEDGKRGRRP